jgi:hypothetical protein
MHLSSEAALDFAEGRLPKDLVGFWNDHLMTCTACTEDVAEWRKLGTNLKRSHLISAPQEDLDQALHIFPKASSAGSQLRHVLASIIFDSFQQPAFAGARGAAAQSQQLVLRAEEFDIHVKIWGEFAHRQLLGQVLPRSGEEFVGAAHFHLLRNGERLESTAVDDMGEFHFTDIPEGDLSLQIDLPNLTVIGALKTRRSEEL